MQQPQNNITSVLNPVLQPNFAQYQDDKLMMASKYLKVISVMASISFPIGVTLCFCGPEIIRLMYGPQWEDAIQCFQVLCLSLPCAMLTSTTGSIYQASNATKHLFYVGLVNSTGMVVCFIIASYYFRTIVAVALAWTLFGIVGTAITYTVMFRLVFKYSVLSVLKQLIKPFGNLVLLLLVMGVFYYVVALPMIPSLLLKLFSATTLTIIYMQVTGEYDIILHVKKYISQLKKNL